MSGSIFSQKDGVMGEDVKDTSVRKSAQDGGTIGITNEVQESGAERNNSSVSSKAVANGSHGVLSNSKADVTLRVSSLLEVPKRFSLS